MNKRSTLSLGLILVVAIALTFFKVPLASSQGVTLLAAQVTGDLPVTDPNSSLWRQAAAVVVPLSAQNLTKPMLLDAKVKSVSARALFNDSEIAVLVEWADDTENARMVRVQDFRDAVALQFPMAAGQPFFCMGQEGGDVNIWHWKADWQADLTARQDVETLYPNMYVDQYPFTGAGQAVLEGPGDYTDPNYLPALASRNLFANATRSTPVEDLIAGGFGSLTSQPAEGQNVQGYGVWAAGKWRVIFSRELVSGDADDVTFSLEKVYSMAFAAWDGANGERNGQKSTSQWVSLQLGSAAPALPQAQPTAGPNILEPILYLVVPMALVTLAVAGAVAGLFVLSKLPEKK